MVSLHRSNPRSLDIRFEAHGPPADFAFFGRAPELLYLSALICSDPTVLYPARMSDMNYHKLFCILNTAFECITHLPGIKSPYGDVLLLGWSMRDPIPILLVIIHSGITRRDSGPLTTSTLLSLRTSSLAQRALSLLLVIMAILVLWWRVLVSTWSAPATSKSVTIECKKAESRRPVS